MTEETNNAGAPEELVELFDRVVGQYPDAERRLNQGFPGAYMNGNLVCELTEDRVMLRLSERDRETFLELDDASACESSSEEEEGNAELAEFVMTPAALMEDEALLDRWLGKSFTYVCTLPDKPGSRNNSRGNNGNSIHARENSNQRGSNRSNNPRNNRGRKKTSKKTSRKTGGGGGNGGGTGGGRKKTSRKTGGRRNPRGRPQGQRSQGQDQS